LTLPSPSPQPLDDASVLEVLSLGNLDVVGRIVDASNATLYATATHESVVLPCVYKPVGGERPLWDFPARTLARREVAAYLVAVTAGWPVVPPTVLRDGPFGPGSVQAWVGPAVQADGSVTVHAGLTDPGAGLIDIVPLGAVPGGWLRVLDAEGYDGRPVTLVHADHVDLRRMALLDIVVNNADRKGGHVLRDVGGRVFGVDHGLTFNLEDKLRTVLWGWAGERFSDESRACLAALADALRPAGNLRRTLSDLLCAAEAELTAERVQTLIERDRFPRPRGGRPHIPWPAF
jgi:uncharacterized repeat protein (TIGR03843 family)